MRLSLRAEAVGQEREIRQKTFKFGLKSAALSGCYVYSLFIINYCFKKTGGFCAMCCDLSMLLLIADSEFRAGFVEQKKAMRRHIFFLRRSHPVYVTSKVPGVCREDFNDQMSAQNTQDVLR